MNNLNINDILNKSNTLYFYYKYAVEKDYSADLKKVYKHLGLLDTNNENMTELGKYIRKFSNLVEYYMNIYTPEKRNYNVLRKGLNEYAKEELMSELETELYYLYNYNAQYSTKLKKIKLIYDIGSGDNENTVYKNILMNVFNNDVKYITVDKDIKINVCENKNVMDKDYVFNKYNYKNNEILYWMSEFLHCKKMNIEILNKISKHSIIFINELKYNVFTEYRLKQTNGYILENEPNIFNRIDIKYMRNYAHTHVLYITGGENND